MRGAKGVNVFRLGFVLGVDKSVPRAGAKVVATGTRTIGAGVTGN